MNILLVTGVFPSSNREKVLGGGAKAVYIIASGLSKRGHTVKILAPGVNNQEWKYQGVSVISIRSNSIFEKDNDFLIGLSIVRRELEFQRAITKINENWKIDVIQYAGWYGVGLLHFSRIPSVMRISSYTKQLDLGYSDRRTKMLSCLECMAAQRMNFIYAPGNVTVKALERDTKRKVATIETPYIPELVKEDTKIFDTKLYGKRYLLFFGNFQPYKGIYVIKDILNNILTKYEDIYFVFVANVPEKKMEREFITAAGENGDRVMFLGKLPHTSLFPIIREAESILMPSLMDNFPNGCAEAMALGNVVIGTDGSSLEQFITDGYNGFLAQRNSAESLEEKVNQSLNLSVEERKKMIQHAKERIKELDPEDYFTKLEKIYTKVINRNR